jgi:pre-mRNA-splicing factor 38B
LYRRLRVGFLYVRYVRDPKEFGRWMDPFIRDDEKFAPGEGGKDVTMGAFVRDLILVGLHKLNAVDHSF